MGKEIEIRYELTNRVNLIEWLDKYAIKGAKSHQIDTYYDNKYHSFVTDKEHIYEWLRIREEDSCASINYKHWLPEDQIERTYCDEYELIIESPQNMKKILEMMGFEVFIIVDKIRYTWRWNDIEVAIDKVLGLGDYIEIEYKGHQKEDIGEITEYLYSLIEEMGAEVGKEDHGGYGFKLIQKKLSD